MSTWRILEWSRERGRGAIAGHHFDRVEFDAAHADVDDFVIGETVHVELEGSGPGLRVRRIWPDIPRFPGKDGGTAAPLDKALCRGAEKAIAAASVWTDVRVELGATEIRLELDDDGFAYGHRAVLTMVEPRYVELPTEIDVTLIQLAGPAARSYLATRMELGAMDIAVALIDDGNRFFFVVARGITYAKTR